MPDITAYHNRYLNGECWTFAAALQRRFGWPLAALLDQDDDPIHLVALRDGITEHLVDVRGVLTQEEVRCDMADAEDSWFKMSISAADMDRWIADGLLDRPSETDVTEALAVIDTLLSFDADYFTPIAELTTTIAP